MEFVNYKCLESLLIEGEELIATEEVASGITNFASKVPIYFKFPNAKIKSIVLPGNLIYFDDLMNICIKNNLTATDFAKFISTYGKSIDSTDEYFLNRGLTKSKDLIYVGTHQNVGLDIFYSKTRKAFVTISEDESVNNITSDDFVSWKDVIQSYKSNKDIIWNSATESSNSRIDNNRIKSYIIKRIMQLVPFIINDKNTSSINVKLLVSKSAYSLDFTATVNKIKYNAMKMVDDGMIKEKDFNACAEDIAKFVRKQTSYNPSKVNKYSFSFMPDGAILNDGEITTGKSKFIDLTGGGPIDDNIQY